MRSELTAIHRSRPSVAVRLCNDLGLVRSRIYDYGCGTGQDISFLQSLSYDVAGWDPFYRKDMPPSSFPSRAFKSIFCTYVLNVIQKNDRISVVKEIKRILAADGYAFVTVRSALDIEDKALKGNWKKYRDGWLSKRGTFQKGFSSVELDSVLHKCGFTRTLTISKNPVIAVCSTR